MTCGSLLSMDDANIDGRPSFRLSCSWIATSRSHWCRVNMSRHCIISSIPIRSWNCNTFSVWVCDRPSRLSVSMLFANHKIPCKRNEWISMIRNIWTVEKFLIFANKWQVLKIRQWRHLRTGVSSTQFFFRLFHWYSLWPNVFTENQERNSSNCS